MEMIDAIFPQTLPSGPAMGMIQASPVTDGVVIEAEITGIVPGFTQNVAGTALPLLFEMLLTQLAGAKEAGAKEADAKAPDAADTRMEPSPDEMSVLASLVPS